MCRIFGFRSVISSGVHRSLLSADNALGEQSGQHPDGWGVAFYVDGAPHVTRSPTTALGDALFHRLSGVVSSMTVLAHVRKATQGAKTVLNCHPFQYGKWVFAHNGDIPRFAERGDALRAEIAPHLRRYVLGDTDSEVLFYVILSRLAQYGPLSKQHAAEDVIRAASGAISRVREICDGPHGSEAAERALVTFVLTDGETMVAHQGGRELNWSSHKTRCADRESCAKLSPECEAPSASGYVNHLLFSSEPLAGENVWAPLTEGDVVGVDWRMRLVRARMGDRPLAVVG